MSRDYVAEALGEKAKVVDGNPEPKPNGHGMNGTHRTSSDSPPPGLYWSEDATGRRNAWWRPDPDLVKRGYESTSTHLWGGVGEPVDYHKDIVEPCEKYQAEMLAWADKNGGQKQKPEPAAEPDEQEHSTPAHDPEKALAEMNAIHATVSVAGKFRVMTYLPHPIFPLQRIAMFSSKDDFCNHVITPRIAVTEKKDGGTKRIEKPRGQWWLNHPDHRRFDDIDFVPGGTNPIAVKDASIPGRAIRKANMFSGFSVVRAKGDCQLYLNHVREHVCGNNTIVYNYVLSWMASGVQDPGNPARVALSLRGFPGSGKGVFATEYGYIFGRHFLHLTQREHIVGKFNAHSAEACQIFADESLFVGDARDADIIKTLVSEKTKMLERKGIDAVSVRNYGRLIFSTNHDHPLRIEVHDRRYCPLNCILPADMTGAAGADKRKGYFLPIIHQMNNGGRAALLNTLLDLDISRWNPEAIPQTDELDRQKLLSASPGDQAVITLAQDGTMPGALELRPWIARSHMDHDRAGLLDHMKRRGGRVLERASDNVLSGILKDWGFSKKNLREGNGWVAPCLVDLRAKIRQTYPAVEFNDAITEWQPPGTGEED